MIASYGKRQTSKASSIVTAYSPPQFHHGPSERARLETLALTRHVLLLLVPSDCQRLRIKPFCSHIGREPDSHKPWQGRAAGCARR